MFASRFSGVSYGSLFVDSSNDTTSYRWMCRISRVLILLPLVSAPWCFAGVLTSVQYWLYWPIVCSLLVWILGALWQSCIRGLDTNRIPIVLIPMLGCLMLINYQLSEPIHPISPEAIQKDFDQSIEKSTLEVQRRELGKASIISSLRHGWTICKSATQLDKAKLVIACATFFLSSQLFATLRTQILLWTIVAVNGGALTILGICQELTWNGKLYWIVPLRNGGSPFSSFVNRNNAAGYLCVCLAAAIGLVVFVFIDPLLSRSESMSKSGPGAGRLGGNRRFGPPKLSQLGDLTTYQLMVMVLSMLLITGVVFAGSRGGWLAFSTAAVITSLAAGYKHSRSVIRFWIGCIVTVIVFVVWIGVSERVGNRIHEFASIDLVARDGRWLHWSDSIHAIVDFPLFGTGFGTYKYAYLPYQTHEKISHARFVNADNQFLEWAVEGGVAGISLVLVSILMFFGTVVILLKTSNAESAGLVGLFVLTSQCSSAFFDFGPEMPANMIVLAAMLGSISGHTALNAKLNQLRKGSWGLSFPPLYPSVLLPCFSVWILCIAYFAIQDVKSAASVDLVTKNLPRLDTPTALDEKSTTRLIQQLDEATATFRDPEGYLALAELLIYRFRLHAFINTQQTQPQRDPTEIWLLTNPVVYCTQIKDWEETGQLERIEALRQTSAVRDNLLPAYQSLKKSQAACALIPNAPQLLALLDVFSQFDVKKAESQLRRSLVLSPANSTAFFQAGEIAFFCGLTEFSFDCFKRSLELAPEHLAKIHQLSAAILSFDDELEMVIPKTGDILMRLADLFSGADESSKRLVLAKRAITLLFNESDTPNDADRLHLRGKACVIVGKLDVAEEEFRRALTQTPYRTDWRHELVDLLLQSKGPADALKEAEICLAIAPAENRSRDLVQKLRKMVSP